MLESEFRNSDNQCYVGPGGVEEKWHGGVDTLRLPPDLHPAADQRRPGRGQAADELQQPQSFLARIPGAKMNLNASKTY